MKDKELVLLVAGHRMGQLRRAGERLTLTYDAEWRAHPEAFPLSLNLPLEQEIHRGAPVTAFLQGLLPDNDAVLNEWGRRYGVSPRNPFRLLTHMGEECAGAVQFVPPERVEALLSNAPPSIRWLSEREMADRLRTLATDATASRQDGDPGPFSLAGAQPKMALYSDGTRWGVPGGRVPTTHILKPPIPGFDGHVENEHFCLELAADLGLPVAQSRVVTFERETAIVVQRYDRVADPQGVIQRAHQEDACQALGIPPDRKYENQGGPGAMALLQLLELHSSAPAQDRATFVRALIYQWLIGGTDAHAKNYALLIGSNQVRLAPLYDVASALPYYPLDVRRLRLAMQVDGEYLLTRIVPRHWDAFADEARLDRAWVLGEIDTMARALPHRASMVAAAMRGSGLTHPIIGQLKEQLTARALICRDSLDTARE